MQGGNVSCLPEADIAHLQKGGYQTFAANANFRGRLAIADAHSPDAGPLNLMCLDHLGQQGCIHAKILESRAEFAATDRVFGNRFADRPFKSA